MQDNRTYQTPTASADVDQMTKDVTKLKSDFATLSDSFANVAKSQTDAAKEGIKGTVAAASTALADTAGSVQASVNQFAGAAQEKAAATQADLETAIEANPLTAVLIAGGIGLLVGMMIAK